MSKIGILESTQFQQIWPFFVGIGLTRKLTLVNPFPTKVESTRFQQIWPFFVGIGLTQQVTMPGQPDSNKVNPIPTKEVNPIPTKSTRFRQSPLSQPDSNKGRVNPIPTNKSTRLQLILLETCKNRTVKAGCTTSIAKYICVLKCWPNGWSVLDFLREDWISMHAGFGAFLTPPPIG